jgi:hypothetical protein
MKEDRMKSPLFMINGSGGDAVHAVMSGKPVLDADREPFENRTLPLAKPEEETVYAAIRSE